MKCIIVVLLIIPSTVVGQKAGGINPFQERADSIMGHFLGTEIFQRYVRLDPKKSQYRQRGHTTSFNRRLAFKPDSYFYVYKFHHPKFQGRTHVVAFTLDAKGQFIVNDETRGLIHIPSVNDSTWTSGSKAISISADQAVRIKKRSLRIEWDPGGISYDLYLKTYDYRDIVPGDIVWKIDGQVEFRGQRYSGVFQVNVLTGSIARLFAIPWD
jgi:hypothetical protein